MLWIVSLPHGIYSLIKNCPLFYLSVSLTAGANQKSWVRRSSVRVRRSSVRMRRSSVGSALACCKAGPSSILGSAPHWDDQRWRNGVKSQRIAMDLTYECDRIDILQALFYFKHKQKEWHHATNLKKERRKFKGFDQWEKRWVESGSIR